MSEESISFQVPLEMGGTRIDAGVMEFLAQAALVGDLDVTLTGASRNRVRQWIKDGHLVVNSLQVKPAAKLKGGETISLKIPEPVVAHLLPEPMDLEVLYEDQDLIIVNKAANLVVHPGAGHPTGTLVQGLLHHCQDLSGIGGEMRPGIVHRLDRGTSGCLVAAKNDFAHERIAAQFAEREVQKTYLAVVMGRPQPSHGKIETLYARHPRDRKKFSSKVTRGKKAVTHYEITESRGGIALVQIELETGRTHQIRVHFADKNNPVVGDTLYGGCQWQRVGAEDLREAARQLNHQALHAMRIKLVHPRSGESVEVEAPIPEPMRTLVTLMSGLV